MNAGTPGGAWREAVEEILGHRFRDPAWLEIALTHPSLAHELGLPSNERLELLGDAVIGLVVTHLLFDAHPDWDEGLLTRARLGLVSRRALAGSARVLRLGDFVRLGRTEIKSDGANKEGVLGDLFEAVVGAMYLDAGLEPVRALAARLFASAFEPGAPPPERDPKVRLQEWTQSRHRLLPVYRTLRDSGIDGDAVRFTVEVAVAGRALAEGIGRTRREAERAAAEAAWPQLESDDARDEHDRAGDE